MMRIALPKGRLLENVLDLLEKSGVSFEFKDDRDYTPSSNTVDIQAKLIKVRAIPQLVALNQFQIGFAGLDLLKEGGYDEVTPVLDLKLNPVRLVVAVPEEMERILENPPKRPLLIATEYERIASEWAMSRNLAHIIIQTWGSTEAYPPDDADIIFDNVETGNTLRANNLVIIDEILESSTHMIVNRTALDDPEMGLEISKFIDRIKRNLGGSQ